MIKLISLRSRTLNELRTKRTSFWAQEGCPLGPQMAQSFQAGDNQWLDLYHSAIAEFDRQKLLERIERAERAILERIRKLQDATQTDGDEELRLSDAMKSLGDLRKTVDGHHR